MMAWCGAMTGRGVRECRLRASAGLAGVWMLVAAGSLPSCNPGREKSVAGEDEVLMRCGPVEVKIGDLERHLDEAHAGRRDEEAREKALAELGRRAQLVSMALDSRILEDVEVRAEMARLLANRVRELRLHPGLKSAEADVSEERLRALYEANKGQFEAAAKRRLAVLWLSPGPDPERQAAYRERLEEARRWVLEQGAGAPGAERGFGELAVDYSEHHPSRFGGGIVGWVEREGGMDPWMSAVAEIGFGLKKAGDVSEAIIRQEGVFLVRLVEEKPAVARTFESVRDDIKNREIRRLREEMEESFWREAEQNHPLTIERSALPDRAAQASSGKGEKREIQQEIGMPPESATERRQAGQSR
jgi:hypothetical protein